MRRATRKNDASIEAKTGVGLQVIAMDVLVICWLIALFLAILALLVVWLRKSETYNNNRAVYLTGYALIPSLLPILETTLHLIIRPSYFSHYTRWPFFLCSAIAILPMFASFLDFRTCRLSRTMSFIRVLHVFTWISGILVLCAFELMRH
jgi:hypothetical protein